MIKLKKIKVLLTFLLLLLCITGCSQESEEAKQKEITIAGSSSGATILKLIQEPFEVNNPNILINFLPSTGSGDGIRGVSEELIDVGTTARKMKESEKEQYPNVKEFTFVKDAMVLAVHENVNIDGLTSEQIKKIFAGEISDWSEVGGQEGKIILLDREEKESSKILLRKHILGDDLEVTDNAILINSADAMNIAIVETPNALGQTSLGVIKKEQLNIKPIAVDGIIPSYSSVKDGSYTLTRDYGVVISSDRADSHIEAFVDFIFSEHANQIFKKYDFVTLDKK